MELVVDIDPVVDVEMMMMEAVHKNSMLVDVVYLMLVMIDHVVVELVDKVVQLED
jgi:hypothetical protein